MVRFPVELGKHISTLIDLPCSAWSYNLMQIMKSFLLPEVDAP